MQAPSLLWMIGLIFIGAILVAVLNKPTRALIAIFKERAPLVKKYWQLVVPLVMLTIGAYIITYLYVKTEVFYEIIGQVSGLALGIIAGYIAFTELGENRFEKLQDSGMDEFRALRFKSAQVKLEEAHRIKSRDVGLLGNLMELYIILGHYEKFDSKIAHYQRIAVEEAEELVLLYLIALKEAVRDRPKDTKIKIKDVIQYVTNHPHARDTLGWSDNELVKCEDYKLLSTESKDLAKNTLYYVTEKLDEEQEVRFTEGDYTLKKRPRSAAE